MKEIFQENRIGKPHYAYSTRMNPAPSHGNVDVIWDLGVHDISIAVYLWEKPPVSVRASGGCFAHGGCVDAATIELYFDDNKPTYHHVGWLTSAKERSYFVAAQNGSMKFDDTIPEKLCVTGPAIDTRKDSAAQNGPIFYAAGKKEVVALQNGEPLRRECEDFIQAIINGRQMRSDGQLGHTVVNVLSAASASIRNGGKIVNIDKA